MEKLFRLLGLVLLMLVFPALLVAGDPGTQTYLIDRYSNNAGPGSTMDQLLRLINVGQGGTPLTTPVGDVCANIYVFDNNQEMISCCSCRLTPNELATASVANQLTNNPLTSVIPTAGVIKIVPTPAGTAACSPAVPFTSSDASLLQGFVTHLEKAGSATYITETNMPSVPLAPAEADFLSNACLFVRYLGSSHGKGTCGCAAPGESGTVTYSISGIVSGAGSDGATVQLIGTTTATATADASGNYSFTGLPNGSYTVTPSKSSCNFSPVNQPVTLNGADATGVNFSSVTYSISGTISGAGGNAATVNLSGAANATVTADASGSYTFAGLTNGSYTLTPSKTGFAFTPASQPATVNNANVTAMNFSTLTSSISGTISGAGGNAATVNLSGAATATVTADASGNYAFDGLTDGSYTVTPSKSGFSFSPASRPVTLNSANVSGVNFSTVTYSISGTISGAAGSGATVQLAGTSTATATTDTSGNYSFTGLQNGAYTVTPGKPGFSFSPTNQPVTLNSSNVTGVNFSTVTYTISGAVSGAGGKGATVSLTGAATATVTADASGNYSFAGLTNGSYTVTPSKSGFSYSPGNRSVTISSANVTSVNFSTITYSVSGTISGAGGKAATVSLTGATTATATADASGSYSFSGLTNGSYTVTPSKTGFTFTPASQATTISNANVPGVNFSTVTYSISGKVTGAGGSAATVTLSGAAAATVTADGSGKYTFAGLTNGSYTVTPSKSGFSYSPGSRSVTLNSSNVTGVNFSTVTYSISGTISGTGGNSASVTLSGTASATATADAFGNYIFANLVNGSYTVTPSNPGYVFTPASLPVLVSGADVAAVNFASTAQLAIDQAVSTDRGSAGAAITSPAFTTNSANELLLAFISTDANSAGITVTSVTSADGTLTWSLVARTNTQLGTSEIWRAFAPAPVSGTSVTASLSQSVAASITVVTFTGVDSSTLDGSGAIGAIGGNSANPGAPTASLTTTRNNSWVIGVGNDWESATSRTPGADQTMVHQFLAPKGDTFWVQSQTRTTPLAGTVVTINDTAPAGDRYNLSICEILPAP
jgi:hypothetical protein